MATSLCLYFTKVAFHIYVSVPRWRCARKTYLVWLSVWGKEYQLHKKGARSLFLWLVSELAISLKISNLFSGFRQIRSVCWDSWWGIDGTQQNNCFWNIYIFLHINPWLCFAQIFHGNLWDIHMVPASRKSANKISEFLSHQSNHFCHCLV